MSNTRKARIVDGGPLADVADARIDGEVFAYLDTCTPACHSDTGEPLMDTAGALADCVIYSPSFRRMQYVAVIASDLIFAVGFGQCGVAVRLPLEARERALDAGEKTADYFGPEWIALELFRAGWTREALQAWVREAHKYAMSAMP